MVLRQMLIAMKYFKTMRLLFVAVASDVRGSAVSVASLLLLAFVFQASARPQEAIEENQINIETVQCVGLKLVSCDSVKKWMGLNKVDAISHDELKLIEIKLLSMPVFEHAEIKLEKGGQKNWFIVILNLKEANPVNFQSQIGMKFGDGYNVAEFQAQAGHANVFGKGKILSLYGRFDQPTHGYFEPGELQKPYQYRLLFGPEREVSLTYIDPNIAASGRWFVKVRAGHEWVHLKGGRPENTSMNDPYQRILATRWFADTELGRRIKPFSHLFIRNQLVLTHQKDVGLIGLAYDPVSMTYTDQVIALPSRAMWRNGTLFGYGWNTEDDFYFPTRGSSFEFGLGLIFSRRDDFNRILSGNSYRPGPSLIDVIDLQASLAFRKHWTTPRRFNLTLSFGSPLQPYEFIEDQAPRFGFQVARELKRSYRNPKIKHARGYIFNDLFLEPGILFSGFGDKNEGTFRMGFQIDHLDFGLINLYTEIRRSNYRNQF